MSKVILCPGQGAQAVGMAKAWCAASAEARAVFAEADAALAGTLPGGATLSSLCFDGPADLLNRTDVSQPAIYTASIACWRALLASWSCTSAKEAAVVAAAGLSLGEYTALHIAGSVSFADGLRLVALRGQAMQKAAEAVPSGMVALIGGDEAQANAVCAAAAQGEVLVCANFNAPGQIVLSGSKSACERAVTEAGKIGLRATALAVAGAFHSPIMAPAAQQLGEALARTAISAPQCTVYANVTAQPHPAGADAPAVIRARLVEQLTSPVRWAESCAAMAKALPSAEYHELAPGKTLMGLYRRIDKAVRVNTHDEPAA
ncbi:MAG: ACP S-malonyltransferase [Planctomycetaceae bacterium]|jgi:[acyl-carrier-protein] S-malonyltransferase|nr:ACP S-malonyltransferase [Planctomycetaceae bacterium]